MAFGGGRVVAGMANGNRFPARRECLPPPAPGVRDMDHDMDVERRGM
jgi:hypothetical protein